MVKYLALPEAALPEPEYPVVVYGQDAEYPVVLYDEPITAERALSLPEVQNWQAVYKGAKSDLAFAEEHLDVMQTQVLTFSPAAREIGNHVVGLTRGALDSANDAINAQDATLVLVNNLESSVRKKPEIQDATKQIYHAHERIFSRGVDAVQATDRALQVAAVSESRVKDHPNALKFLADPDSDDGRAALHSLDEEFPEVMAPVKKFLHTKKTLIQRLRSGFAKHWDLLGAATWTVLAGINLGVVLGGGTGVMSAILGTSIAGAIAWPVGVPAAVLLAAGLCVWGGVIFLRRRKAKKVAAALVQPVADV